MSKESYEILSELRNAKDEVKRLERRYREVCACNERLPGMENVKLDEIYLNYQKINKTCDYHTLREVK